VAKKKFTSGLESVFGDTSEAYVPGADVVSPLKKKKGRKTSTTKRRHSSAKNFTSDLDSLFETALEEAIVESKSVGTAGTRAFKKRVKKPSITGLDALIRSTVEDNYEELVPKELKRVTFTTRKEHVMKLKQIARREKKYIKDILGKLLEGFLEEYESKD